MSLKIFKVVIFYDIKVKFTNENVFYIKTTNSCWNDLKFIGVTDYEKIVIFETEFRILIK